MGISNPTIQSQTMPIFGDGSDGAVVIAANTNLVRDMYYSSLTVNAGFALNCLGFRVFCTGNIINAGTIKNNGNNGTTATILNPAVGQFAPGGAALVAGTIDVTGGAGGDGGVVTVPPVAGANTTVTFGGAGGAGGAGSDGAGAAGGTATVPTAVQAIPRDLSLGWLFQTITQVRNQHGAGGGGGNSGVDNVPVNRGGGGGGGSGGGLLIICARSIANVGGVISCNGGNGGNAYDAGAIFKTGGGGGGGGGTIVLIYGQLSAGTEQCAGGAFGLGGSIAPGAPGTAGSAGTVFKITI